MKRALAKISPTVRRAVQTDVIQAVTRFERRGKLRIPNEAILAVATRFSP